MSSSLILAGDIGGTKTNLALIELEGMLTRTLAAQSFDSRGHASLENVVQIFLDQHKQARIYAACFGVAGPVINGECRATNLPWVIASDSLAGALGLQRVGLLNDLATTAYGMLRLPESEFVDLNPTGKRTDGHRAVIAAGTGIGEAMLYWDGARYHPVASEGGHADFAPRNSLQDDLLVWMRQRYPDHVSIERILSGPAIENLYQFLHESDHASPLAETVAALDAAADRSRVISEIALAGKDPLCQATMALFIEVYGAEAGNLALKYLSTGGVYIGGGIAPKILPLMRQKAFMQNFLAKGRFQPLLQKMRVRVSMNPHTAVLGAAHYAREFL